MSWLLSENEFVAAAEAADRGEVTPPLFAFLHRLVASVARSGTLAPALSPSGQWNDDAIADVLQDWLTERLLVGGLWQAFDSTASPRALSRYLERALRNFLISKGRSRAAPRLLPRARKLLQDDPGFRCFVEASAAMDQAWGLAEWERPEVYAGDEAELVSAVYSLGEFALIRFAPTSARAEPVISNEDLSRLLRGLLDRVGRLLTLRHIDASLRGRFAWAFQAPDVDLESAQDTRASDYAPLAALEIADAAMQALGELTGRQLAILLDRAYADLTLDQLAERHGISRSTADNELKRAGVVIAENVSSQEHLNAVLERLLELASYERE